MWEEVCTIIVEAWLVKVQGCHEVKYPLRKLGKDLGKQETGGPIDVSLVNEFFQSNTDTYVAVQYVV
jgi:hypothetical protein